MINELENKIRKAIPELMELGVGCVVRAEEQLYTINGNTITFNDSDVVIVDFGLPMYFYDYEIIGKPIQLNHVLEYAYKSLTYQNAKIGQDDYIIERVCRLWNLKSNLLSEQSSELIKYINEL